MVDIEKSKLPVEVREGDVLKIVKDSIIIDTAETEKKRSEIEELTKDLWKY